MKIIVEGKFACFTRCDEKVERMSYPVPTPSAIEGVLKAVYWKPAIRYVIDEVVVFNPIMYVSVTENERKVMTSMDLVEKEMYGEGGDPRSYRKKDAETKRTSLILKDVRYGVGFHTELTGIRSDNPDECAKKHDEILRRRLENGRSHRVPYLGQRQFSVDDISLTEEFDLSAVDESLKGEKDLGLMLYGIKFDDDEAALKREWSPKHFSDSAEAVFYHPRMVGGVIDVAKYRKEMER